MASGDQERYRGRRPTVDHAGKILYQGTTSSGSILLPLKCGVSEMKFAPLSDAELLEVFRGDSSSGRHMLIVYSLIIGLNAQVIIDLGLGNSTRVALSAARKTKGIVYSCDNDQKFQALTVKSDKRWRFFCQPSSEFIENVPPPFDFVFHDSSHQLEIVLDDLCAIIPRMKKFGLICVHDTQHPRFQLLEAVSRAIRAAAPNNEVRAVTLPFNCGLTIMRVETGGHVPITPSLEFRKGRRMTEPHSDPSLSRGGGKSLYDEESSAGPDLSKAFLLPEARQRRISRETRDG